MTNYKTFIDLPMKKYRVKIYEEPFVYEVMAKDKQEAEVVAVNKHNGAEWDEIHKVVIASCK